MLNEQWKTDNQLYLAWSDSWLQPLVSALYQEEFTQAEDLLQRAQDRFIESDLAPAVREAVAYSLLFYRFRLYWQQDITRWTKASFQEAMDALSTPSSTAYGERQRLLWQYTIWFHAELDGYTEISGQDIASLLERFSDDPEISSMWHYIASWAFRHRDLPLLERAYSEHLTNPSRMLGQAKWQRVNLMYLLVSGKVTKRDIEESIKLLQIKPQLQEFTQHLWPACLETGLVDSELQSQLAERSAEIQAAAERELKLLERRTKAIRTNLPDKH